MATEIISKSAYEYQYQDSALTHTDSYLRVPLLSILSDKAKPGARILDLGCGNGSLSHILAQHGYDVVGMEDSASGITIARQNFPDCQFIQASIYDSPKAELLNAFDIVIAVEVIEHLLYPRELVKLAQKCLKPGGHLIITTPYHGYLKNLIVALLGKMDSHFSPLWDGGHIKFFSVKSLTHLLETEDCIDISFQFAGRFPYLWKSMLCSAFVAEK
ncbi:methyltransferase domain-containing protein [Scytonema sp. UIC 10036]|uniref:class I SAM-dependent methyltransferase n=1 Tax=Scytonema sp. UIC 10036 TaxID=2304196 RepID=UPI0012DABBB8|nr:class I SAM-dependent methyltransferase [Scytonema sp. UIC 10036]MUG94056.1 methyltransferase domain-containing protein [Scytonema sp. UIC 10036]